MRKLSIVIPCYNEEENVRPFYEEFIKNVPFFAEKEIDFELWYIDDGSKDRTVDEVKALATEDSRVHMISFSRNFGKEAAMLAGLRASTGDLVSVMDSDLQDPPALLPEMLRAIDEEGYDQVGTRRVTRKGEPPIRSFFARLFYKLINRFSETEIVDGARDFRLMTRPVVDAVLSLSEYNRFSKGIFSWVGFKTKWLEYENIERAHGRTKFSFWKLFHYAMEGIVSFTTAPLKLASYTGVCCCLLAVVMIIFIVVRTLVFGDPTSGWPSLVCIILLVGGIQLLCLGALGEYLEKTYLEAKDRPIYIERERI